jgi:hypothetical protein
LGIVADDLADPRFDLDQIGPPGWTDGERVAIEVAFALMDGEVRDDMPFVIEPLSQLSQRVSFPVVDRLPDLM